MILDMNWTGKKVLVIGCGVQGKRKGAQFEREGAIVDYEDVGFQWSGILAYDLVIACTDDKECNRQIVQYACDHGVWCASATYEENASAHFMRALDLEELEIGISTKHGFLMYGETIAHDIRDMYDKKWKEKLEVLRLLRPAVQGHKELMRFLMGLRSGQLWMLAKFNERKAGAVCVFHSCPNEKQYANMQGFCGKACLVFFLDENLDLLLTFFSLCEIDAQIVGMFVFKGYIYGKFEKILLAHGCRVPELLLDEKGWRFLLKEIDRPDSVFVVHTSREHLLKKTILSCARHAQVVEYDETIGWNMPVMRIYPLFMNEGMHVLRDVKKQIEEGKRLGYEVEMPYSCLLDMDRFKILFDENLSLKNI